MLVSSLARSLVERGIDLRIGVVSADLGSAGGVFYDDYPTSGCGRPCDRLDGTSSSDEGRLLTLPDCWPEEPERCWWQESPPEQFPYPPPPGGYPAFLDAGDPRFGEWIHLLVVRSDGCALSQPLESLFRALDGRTNPGFLREGSVLAVLHVSRRDDCSVADPAAVAPFSADRPGGFVSRCSWRSDLLHPVERYADRLLAIRPAERLVVGVFAGIDAEPRWCTGSEPACAETSGPCDAEHPCLLWESCPRPEGLSLPPAPRLHDFSRRLGVTVDGRPVAVHGSSCAFHDGDTSLVAESFREEILERARRASR
jgi:hypothetical protein